MRPKERRDTGQTDLLRSRLDAIIDMGHPLVKLARTIDWSFLEQRFGAVYEDKPGRPPLPTRLMAGLAILKHTYDLSDEVLCERWLENPYYQFFCGEEFFQHRLVFDRSSLTRWRQRMGEERLQALLQESLSVASKTEAIKPSDLNRIIVDTTVQPKNVMFPTDARLLNRARENAVIAQVEVEWREADVEELPFGDEQFDIVLSQFAHMFAPRPEVALGQMLRTLKPGGTIAFSTWPAELLVGRTMALGPRYLPPPPGFPSPLLWGEPAVIRERLGNAVEDVVFDRGRMLVPALSPQHFRAAIERSAGPLIKLVEALGAKDPDRLRAFRQEFDSIVAEYLEDNLVRQDYLMTRARKI